MREDILQISYDVISYKKKEEKRQSKNYMYGWNSWNDEEDTT